MAPIGEGDGMDLEALIGQAKQGDLDAFAEVTRRFQHMAFGYALSIVRDLQQAEDVVQEAFVAAWFGLLTLADPAAFPGWFRGIVRHRVSSAARDLSTQRARKLLRFFAQPFFVAEPYTKQPGLYVSREDALRGCRAILSGECDAVPEQASISPGRWKTCCERQARAQGKLLRCASSAAVTACGVSARAWTGHARGRGRRRRTLRPAPPRRRMIGR